MFMLVGIAITGFAGEKFGIVPVINVQSFVYIIGGVFCLIALREHVAKVKLASAQ